jgi:hypothetical protein
MPRKLRIQYPGAIYHIMNCGDQREDIFKNDRYGQYLKAVGQRPVWLRVDRLLGEKGIPGDTEAGRQQFAAQMERRRAEEAAANYDQVRQDWILGSEEFRQELLAAVAGRVGPSHYGAQRRETAAQKAERILKEGLAQLRWTEDQLLARRKGDRGESRVGAPPSTGDHREFQMDCPEVTHGQLDIRFQPPEFETCRHPTRSHATFVSIVRTDTCTAWDAPCYFGDPPCDSGLGMCGTSGGDCGSPTYLLINNELVLVGAVDGGCWSTWLGLHLDEVNPVIASLDSSVHINTGYTVTVTNLDAFPNLR